MLLGSIIANLSDETNILETLASLDDLVLMARLREAAAEAGEPLGCFASAAVGSFVAHADDAAWLSLMAVTGRAEDPGGACLRYILGAEIPMPTPSCSYHHHWRFTTRDIEHGHDGRTGTHPYRAGDS